MIKALVNTNAYRWVAPLVLVAMSLCSGLALAAGDIAAGKEKVLTCNGCHGVDGKAVVPGAPNLAGQNANYLAKQLHEFQAGERINAAMQGMAATLTAEDIENVSAFYESLPRWNFCCGHPCVRGLSWRQRQRESSCRLASIEWTGR